jgi:hypothetical protein
MTSIPELFDIEKWKIVPLKSIAKTIKINDIRNIYSWRNFDKKLSPLSVYKLLKAKFGIANGFSMLFKNASTDNLIHWHYAFTNQQAEINFIGKSSGLEIVIKIPKKLKFEESDWEILIKMLKSSFQTYGKQMNEIQNEFQKYTLFINPFTRLDSTIRSQVIELKSLDISPLKRLNPMTSSDVEMKEFYENLNSWIKNVEKAVGLGTTIRMLTPVLVESFVNLILLVFSKNEFKEDRRLYENLIRQQIDIRVKTLHLNCTCFTKKIDSENEIFKNFQTLMNSRNDFLHGNIDPISLMFEDVYFDMEFIPLFKEDESIIIKTMTNYLKNVEPKTAITDYITAVRFIQFILSHLKKNNKKYLEHLMLTRMPGYNHSTKGIAILFNVGLAEI